jgi:UDP-glucose 4-epimerase
VFFALNAVGLSPYRPSGEMDASPSDRLGVTTWLVTGGAGFIGSHLCRALLIRGDTVRVLDDLSTGRRENLPLGAVLVEGDVANPIAVRDALRGASGCFHLAAIASVERTTNDWFSAHRVNLMGALNVFDAARAARTPLVYASSAAVYGNAVSPITEATICRPLSAYGADKLGCELHARVFGHVHRVPTVGLRFFNVYGPGQDPASPYSGVVSIFCERLRRGRSIDIFGNGGQTRDFVFVTDVVAALLAAMNLASVDAPVYNVCTGIATTVTDMARTVAELIGTRFACCSRAPRPGEILHSMGSPVLLRKTLGLPEPISLHDGLRQVLDWLGCLGS